MHTPTQLAYLAGIIDGEGTVHIGRTGARPRCDYNVRIYVVSTDKILIDWLIGNFGGLSYTRLPKPGSTWKTKYEWVIDRKLLDELGVQLLPYLIIKKPQMELALRFRDSFVPIARINGRLGSLSQEVRDFRLQCCLDMRVLNHRGN